ncbi:MAG: 4-phytase, partial [Chloroflexi bacterium]|nr:4-phytase [Chloroflexota bacterium]
MKLMRVALLAVALLTSACAGTGSAPQPGPSGSAEPSNNVRDGRSGGSVTLAITANVPAMSPIGVASTTTGGWYSLAETHTAALITSDVHTRKPIGRLAERVPSIDGGDISILPDGRMRVLYPLRKGVTWHDGAPFTAQDLVFSYKWDTDSGIPNVQQDLVRQIESVEAPDDYAFVVYFSQPFYRADQVGLRMFWAYPRHILGPVYESYLASRSIDDVLNHPYFTRDYVHLGPFKLVLFDPADTIVFQAFDGYFLGRPKLDTIRMRIFADTNVLFSNLLAGSVDMFPENTLDAEQGFQLMERWEATRDGTVHLRKSAQRFLAHQVRPNVQTEPAMLDVRVRAALYQALDRDAMAEGIQHGHRELAAYELLWPGETLHDATKDAFRRYGFEPERATAMLRDLGWSPNSDGTLRSNADGRRFHTSISATGGAVAEREIAVYADYWKRIGVEAEELVIPAARVRDAEYRALYPSWEASSQAGGDDILARLEG